MASSCARLPGLWNPRSKDPCLGLAGHFGELLKYRVSIENVTPTQLVESVEDERQVSLPEGMPKESRGEMARALVRRVDDVERVPNNPPQTVDLSKVEAFPVMGFDEYRNDARRFAPFGEPTHEVSRECGLGVGCGRGRLKMWFRSPTRGSNRRQPGRT